MDVAFPCATQNELSRDDAKTLLTNGVRSMAEEVNMPTELDGVNVFRDAEILFWTSQSGQCRWCRRFRSETSQNALRLSWNHEEGDSRLQGIHDKCVNYGKVGDHVNYVTGANLAGFVKVADAMLTYGVI